LKACQSIVLGTEPATQSALDILARRGGIKRITLLSATIGDVFCEISRLQVAFEYYVRAAKLTNVLPGLAQGFVVLWRSS